MDKTENVTLELGDIIKITSPLNETTNNNTYIIEYIDTNVIKLINVESFEKHILNIDENGDLLEDYINEIILLDRNQNKGYAKQNDLNVNTWIDIHFIGDLPFIVTGIITNVEEDMIEIKIYPNNDIIYIDFAYQGIPEELNIKEIKIREKPTEKVDEGIELVEDITDDYQLDAYLVPDEVVTTELKDLIIEADSIVIGEELGEIEQTLTIDDKFKRYGIESQTNDLLDELLSTIPTYDRTSKKLNEIHTIIQRYKQLRSIYSTFDENNNANKPKLKGPNYKPLVEKLYNLTNLLYWLIPVVNLQKKVYVEELEQDLDDYIYVKNNSIAFDVINQMELYNNYLSNSISIDSNKYNHLYNQLDKLNTPYYNTNNDDNFTYKLNNLILGIINNYDEFDTDTINNDTITRNKFIFQQYIEKEQISINGFLMFPEPILRYSAINMPGTNIMIKSGFNINSFYYFNLLNNFTKITGTDDNTDENFLKEFKYYNFNEYIENFENKDTKLSEIITYNIDVDLDKTFNQTNKNEKYKLFLNSIVPKTKILFDKIKKYINKPLNFISIIEYLEPFHIYPSDISFKQFLKIMFFLKEELVEYKKKYQENKILFNELKKNKPFKILNISNILNNVEKENLSSYNINYDLSYTSSEILKKILIRDNGYHFFNILSLSSLQLIGMEDINTIINEQLVKLNVESGCANYKISKKYTNEKALLNDNDKVIYYDKEFDLTDYDFINKYQKELSSLPKEEFIIFLSKKLQEDKKLTPDKSVIEANAMISKQRVVLDNIYAILQTDDSKKYYIRKNNKWLLDNDIKDNINSKERWDSLCNVQQDCLIVKNDCVDGSNYINEQLLKNVLTEYDTKNEANKFEITEQLNSDIVNSKDILDKLNYNNTKKSFKHNDYQISIGNDVSVFEGILSPHIELRDRIIGYQDFVKKQTYIVQFAEKYTRLPNEIDEEQHWLYCIETSTKLLPKFMLILANAYIQNLDYNQKLQELCRDIGVLSDDGDTWVDKHSGYVIKSIEFDTDEGYDESGFKYKSRDELAQDLASNFSLENVKLSPEVLMCHNIINALENFIGINISSSKEFITTNVFIQLDKELGDEESYNRMAEQIKLKKGKKVPEYLFQRHSLMLLLTIAYMFVSVITLTPTPKIKKTFPGCIKSFKGYPLDKEDYSGITYFACIVVNIKSSEPPWYTLKSISEKQLVKKLTILLDKILLKDQVIQEKINNKLQFDLTNEDIIPDSINVTNWETFLPPLSSLTLKPSESISDDYIKSLLNNISNGNENQINQINTINGKIIHFSMYIQLLISNIIKNAEPILMNSNKEPFIDNICCNNVKNVMDFLNEKNSSIYKTNNVVSSLSNKMKLIKQFTKANIMFININTRKQYPNTSETLSENTIYKSFIIYCKFNSSTIINSDLLDICIDNKSMFNEDNTIQEKIKIMKQESKFYSIETLHQLHKVINKPIDINNDSTIPNVFDKLEGIIYQLTLQEDNNIPKELLDNLLNLLKDKEEVLVKDTQNMRNIKNYLIVNNNKLKISIKEFISKNSRNSKKTSKEIDLFFNLIEKIFSVKNHNILSSNDQIMYDSTDHLYRYLNDIITIYPNMIKNNVRYNHGDTNIPKHWDLSPIHQIDIKNIMKNHYKLLFELYEDDDLIDFIQRLQPKLYNLLLLASNIPKLATIDNEMNTRYCFDAEISNLLHQHFILLVFDKFINYIDEDYVIKESKIIAPLSTETFEEKDNGDISQIEILIGEKKTNSEKVSNLLIIFINTYLESYSSTIYDYSDIMEKVLRSKEKEKEQFTTYLKELSEDERKVQDIMKKQQLEKWGKGLQKGLIQYDKDTYDEEREHLEKVAIMERKLEKNDIVTDMNKDIYMLETMTQDEIARDIEAEEYDMSYMHNDDDYDEDMEELAIQLGAIREYDD
tara:strand:+ start:809 stop:6547 length:5739 start_codon:yes stop_codon:yes gene_type:complete